MAPRQRGARRAESGGGAAAAAEAAVPAAAPEEEENLSELEVKELLRIVVTETRRSNVLNANIEQLIIEGNNLLKQNLAVSEQVHGAKGKDGVSAVFHNLLMKRNASRACRTLCACLLISSSPFARARSFRRRASWPRPLTSLRRSTRTSLCYSKMICSKSSTPRERSIASGWL